MDFGKMNGQDFLPKIGNPAELLARVTGGAGWSGLDAQTEAAAQVAELRQKASDDVKRAYAWLASQPLGIVILEDLIDQTLRRGASHPDPMAGLEQEALYSRERKGQNSFVVYMLRMAFEGQNLPAPGAAKKQPKKRK